MLKPAVAYMRTSSAANVGTNKDSERRQRDAIQAHAKAAGLKIVREFYDAAVSGADPVDARPAFTEMLAFCGNGGPRVILVENVSRFARDLTVQLTGHAMLKRVGIELIPVDAPDHFTNPGPTAVLIRQILGAVSEFEKAQLVAKLKHARDKKRATGARVEGAKRYVDTEKGKAVLRMLRTLLEADPNATLPAMASGLAKAGHFTREGKPLAPTQVARLIKQLPELERLKC
jgi:DNA invertase Pin-like site-specific DNA recombinase